MPTNLTGRFVLIFGVLLACLYILFPYGFRGDFTPNIRPGIDMVGGSSLLYQIKTADNAPPRPGLADEVIKALRERVDPEGVKNLVWRAQGANQIEIQLPTSAAGEAARPARKAFADAEAELDALNVSRASVEAALALPADQRAARLAELAQRKPQHPGAASQPAAGTSQASERLSVLFKQLADQQAKLDAAKGKDAAAESEARIAIDALLTELPKANVPVSEVEAALAIEDAAARDAKLAELKARDPQAFGPKIDQYVSAYRNLQSVKDAVGDLSELKRLLRGSGVLSFHICAKPEDAGAGRINAMIERLQRDGPRLQPGDELAWIPSDKPIGRSPSAVVQQYNGKSYLLCWITPNKSLRNVEGTPKWALIDARDQNDPDHGLTVSFSFDPVGADLFARLTGNHTPESPGGPYDLAAVLDNRVISHASLNSQIGATGQISGGRGGFQQQEVDYLVRTLRAGSLPAQLGEEPLAERTVGPQLGADNLRAGFIACGFGVGVVAVFLVGYYYLAGCVAMCAMFLNLILILAGMSAVGATFTLPGVAGIILTIGMAVDANVLIFERLREEQHRGLSLRVALRNAYDRAFSAILDSNVTAAVTGVILYAIGTEDVRGFGLTLLLGILSSLFTSLFVTKTVFAVLINNFHIERLNSVPITFPRWERFLHPRIDWMGKAWVFLTFSAIFVVIGLGALVMKFREGRVLDIEFAGGTIVQFNLKEAMAQDDVRKLVEERSVASPGTLDAPAIQSVGDAVTTNDGRRGYMSYEVVTVTSDANAVREALGEALQGKLDVAQAAKFDLSGRPLNEAQAAGLVVAIESANTRIGNFTPSDMGDFVGGVAILLRNLEPRLTPADIQARLDQQRLATGGGASIGSTGGSRKFAVEALPDGTGVVILASDGQHAFDLNNAAALHDWTTNFVAPIWQNVNDAIGNPAEFNRVSSINQSVAGTTSQNAMIALLTTCVLIVIYVWVRFGDLKFGSATVVALLHDVVFMAAALGFAHLLAGTAVGHALLLQPFRVNLTMVSAFLAIIGFSMSDTVVIFDRIRENRHKVGHLDRNVINDSVNQTLSRTLLMGATTTFTLLVMYVTGGEAIHGFTFALFFGLLTGVYSSVAIASPILLLGKHAEYTIPNKPILPTATPANA